MPLYNQLPVNPYKFRAYRNAAANTGNAAYAVLACDTEQYDTGNNHADGVFTAPVNGYYHFDWLVYFTNSATVGIGGTTLYYDGAVYSSGVTKTLAASELMKSNGGDTIYMAEGKTADVRVYAAATSALNVGGINFNYFSGYLVSV